MTAATVHAEALGQLAAAGADALLFAADAGFLHMIV